VSRAFLMAADTSARSRFLPSRWLARLSLAAGGCIALVILAWLVVPLIARQQIESRLTEALGRKTTVEKVEFAPLQLRLTLRKLAVADPNGAAPLFAVDELVANVSSASLWRRAPVLDALKLVRPAVSLARDRGGRYSVQDLIDRALAAPEGPPPAFSLNNIEIDGGSVVFDDGTTATKHRIEDLAIGIPFLSSLKYQAEIRVTPHLEGSFDGSHFAFAGTATPFAEHHAAAIDIDVDALPLKAYVAYLPAKPRLDVAGGALTTHLKVIFTGGIESERKLELRGDARIDGLALARRDGSSLAAANRIAVALDRIDLFGRDVRIASLAVDAPTLELRRLRDGALELAEPLFESMPAAAARREGQRAAGAGTTPTPAAPNKPWAVTVAKTALTAGKLALVDEASTFRSELADVALDAANLSTKAGGKAHVALSFVSADRIATFKGEADVEPLVPAATGTFELTKFSLGLLFPYYKDALAVDVQKGSLDLAADFALLADGNLRLSQGAATITGLALAYPGNRQPFWNFPTMGGSGIDFDLRERSVKVAEFRSRDAVMKLARERNGSIDVARLVKTTETTGTAKDERTWTLAFGKFVFERAAIDLEDRVPEPGVKLAIRDLALTATNYTNARGAKSTTSVRARIGDRGRLMWSGVLSSNPVSFSGQLDVSGLDLVTVRPYVESQVNVSLTSGTLAAKGAIAIDLPEGAPVRAAWKGDAAVTDFAALDKPTASDLLRWRRLALDGVDTATQPFRLSVERIGAEDYFARVIVYQDGTLNLTRLLMPESEPEPAPDAKPAAAPAAQHEPLPVTIGRIELARGNVNFSDFFVRPNYSANLTDVTGTVTTMSAEQAGDIAIAARVDRTAPVEVSGRIDPFAKDLSLDIKAKARDVDLPPLTPYSVKYAGYGIEKGKLSFDVHYRVANRKLAADNQLVLDQLTFNPQHIDSQTATKLPILLAVALLKDARGVIDVRLPIAGSLDDPKFSVGALIVQVIVNLITKAVTAPFALLGAAFGGGEELSTIPFAPGSAALDAEAEKRLETLAKALADRPALKLDIGGRADSEGDREALRRASVVMAMKREKMKSLAASGNAPASVDQVTIGTEERVHWLTEAYRESSIKDRPRNVIGLLKELPPQEMEALLLADAKIDDDALRLLANARAQAVKDALSAQGIGGERLFLTVPRISGERAAAAAGAARAGGGAPASGAASPPTAADSVPPSRVDLALH
jgi:uncharacterized protein involved in outer membrane biogenesis